MAAKYPMKHVALLFLTSAFVVAAGRPAFVAINKKYFNLHAAQLRCAVQMTNDAQSNLQTDSHIVLFGKNKSRVLTAPEKPSARLLNTLLHTLAPVMLRNLLPDRMDKTFSWQGANLVHRYRYRGMPSENTYLFGQGSKLEGIDIRTGDGVKQVGMKFTWVDVGGKYRLERFVNNQHNQNALWDMQVTYSGQVISGFAVPNRILLTLEKDGRTMKHAFIFSDCAAF